MLSPANRNDMPPLWWLNPWAYARSLKAAVELLHDMADESAVKIRHLSVSAEYHRKRMDDFQGKVERKLKAVNGSPSYEDTLDLVDWAGDEVNRLGRDKGLLADEVGRIRRERDGLRDDRNRLADELADAESRLRAMEAVKEGHRKAHEAEMGRAVYWELQAKDARKERDDAKVKGKGKAKGRKPAMARSGKKGGRR